MEGAGGGGDREKRGRGMYGRQEKRGREAGEKGEITQHCAILRNLKNANRWEPTNTERERGLKGTGSGWFKPPVPPPSYGYTSITHGDSPCWWTLWP